MVIFTVRKFRSSNKKFFYITKIAAGYIRDLPAKLSNG